MSLQKSYKETRHMKILQRKCNSEKILEKRRKQFCIGYDTIAIV